MKVNDILHCLMITLVRKLGLIFFQENSSGFHGFSRGSKHLEKEVDSLIRILHTDGGGEYKAQEFYAFCDKHGIKTQLTASYTP